MKKSMTAAAFLAAGIVSMHASAYSISADDWELSNSLYRYTLSEDLDLSADSWSISFTTTVKTGTGTGYNDWGTTIFCSGSNVAATNYGIGGFQVWVGVAGKVVVKGNSFDNSSYGTTIAADGTLTDGGTYTFCIEKDGDDTTFSVLDNVANEIATSTKTITNWSGSVSLLSTGIGSGNATVANGWAFPTGTILTPIPEPSAFGLLAGLGALALVASRRRRK